MATGSFDAVVFEQATDQILRAVVFEEITVKPVVFGITLEESQYNFNLNVSNIIGTPITGALVSISDVTGYSSSLYTDDSGSIETMVRRNTVTTMYVTKNEYQTYTDKFTLLDNDYVRWDIALNSIVPVIHTKKGSFINVDPTNPINQIYR